MKNCVSGVPIIYLGINMGRDGLRAKVNHVHDRPSAVESIAASTYPIEAVRGRQLWV